MKKLIALFLCLTMVLTVLPAAVFAAETETASDNQFVEVESTSAAETESPVIDDDITPSPAEELAEVVSSTKAAKKETRAITPLTEEEAAAIAEQSWDVSEAQDGSITMYKVPNGENTYTMYVFGVGPIKDFPVTSSPYTPWQDNTDITSVYIDEGITAVGNLCFYRFLSLINVELPSTVQRIGSNAFNTCEKLSNITLPEGLHIIGDNSFVRCYELSSINLPEGLVSIGIGTFSKSGLESITIPDSVTTLGDQAFANCPELTNAYLGSGVSSIGAGLFNSCDKMESIDISDENMTFVSVNGILYNMVSNEITSVPLNVSGIIEIPYGITEIPDSTFKCCEKFEGIIIPNSVTTIGQGAFNYAENLKSVYIPASVTTIDRQAFQHCYSLESITVDTNNPKYCSDEYGVLYTKDMKELLCFPAALQLSSYTIPSTVKHIWARAFGGNPYISGTITVPANCDVGFGAFSGCRNLEKVVWKTAPKDTEPYVHENVCPVNQKPASLCAACSIGAAINTFTGLTYNKEEWHEESNRLNALGYNAGVSANGSYGNMAKYGEDFFNYFGIDLEIISPSSTGWKNTIIEAVSEGKMVIFNANMERPKSGYDGAGTQHVMCIFGISDEGYFYAYDPSYLDATMTQYDPELLFDCAHGNTYILSVPTDTTMKTTAIEAEAAITAYPDSYIFTAAEGEKLGSTNGDSTYLAKSSDWTNYQNGTASTSMRFAYEPEAADYIYILDYSESMTRSTVDEDYTNMSVEKTLAYESIEDLLAADPTARVSVVSFKGLNEAVYSEFTNDTSDIYNIIANEKCQGFTCYANGFDAALEAINSRTGEDANRKAVVVFATDGNRNVWVNNDDMSYVTYEVDIAAPVSGDTNFGASEAAALRAAGAEIYAVVLNPDISDVAAAKMTEITADEDKVFVAGTIEELGEAFCGIIDAATLRSFTITDAIGSDFIYNGNLVAAEGTEAVIDEANRTITWTLTDILPNTEYTLSFGIRCGKNSTGNFVTGDLPTNLGDAVVTEDGETVNSVETPVLHRDPTAVADGAQAHMIHKYNDLSRKDNAALYTDGIRFCVSLDMNELQATYEPGDKVAFAIIMQPLDKLQSGDTTNYLTLNIGANGALTSNGSFTFVNNSSAISKTKPITTKNMITWTEAMDNATSTAALAKLLQGAGMNIFGTTEDTIQYSVYMTFSAASRQAQADREIAYRGVTVAYKDGAFSATYTFQRNNSATRIYNQYNCVNYGVINVKGASVEDMMQGESQYNPSLEAQSALVK